MHFLKDLNEMTEDQLDDIIENIMTSTWESGKKRILEFARLMCDKQKEICLKRTGLIPIKGMTGTYLDIDRDCINNSPYPEELQ